jgi:hypothetical protein
MVPSRARSELMEPADALRSSKVKDGFKYKTVPHITLKSIAQNPKLDACETQADRERGKAARPSTWSRRRGSSPTSRTSASTSRSHTSGTGAR